MPSIDEKLIVAIVAAVLVGVIGLFISRLITWLYPKFGNWWSRRIALVKELEVLQRRLDNGLEAVALVDSGSHKVEGNGLWLADSHKQGDDQIYHSNISRSIPIWVFANLKGGVGKTTNATNIAGHYALQGHESETTKPILLIDLDYQGSASSMSLSTADHVPPGGFDSLATRLIRGDLQPADIVAAPLLQKEGVLDNLKMRVVPAYYDLAKAENRLMIEWLFGRVSKDVRYTLADLLHHRDVQENFSHIIIDAPPRLSTACVQALCAATHVIIPTVLDQLSGEAVSTFIDQIEILRKEGVCPHVQYGGIVGYSQGNPTGEPTQQERRRLRDAEDKIRDTLIGNNLDESLYIEEQILTYHTILAESAGQYVAVVRDDARFRNQLERVKEMYSQLAMAIEKRIRECKRA